MPAMKMIAATIGADRQRCDAIRTRNAPQIPPSTASGGNTNTKCRMPLYIAGRNAIVVASGNSAASAIRRKTARRLQGAAPCERRKQGAGRAAKPRTDKIIRQLERE